MPLAREERDGIWFMLCIAQPHVSYTEYDYQQLKDVAFLDFEAKHQRRSTRCVHLKRILPCAFAVAVRGEFTDSMLVVVEIELVSTFFY